MSQSLFDILSVGSTVRTSSFYLNKSIAHFSMLLLSAHKSKIDRGLLEKLNALAESNVLYDRPVAWYVLSLMKSSRADISLQKTSLTENLIRCLVDEKGDFRPSVFTEMVTSGFRYIFPVSLEQDLDFESSEWHCFRDSGEYLVWSGKFKQALHLIHSVDSGLIVNCNQLVRYILVMYSKGGAHGSMSPQNLIGTVYLPDVDDSSLIAECFLHESLHQYLYRIEHCSPLFQSGHGFKELFYSPWKDEPRPLIMVLHGAFVFTGVVLFYDLLLKKNAIDSCMRDEIFGRLGNRIAQVNIALQVLRENNSLSALGSTIVGILGEAIGTVGSGFADQARYLQHDVLAHKLKYCQPNFLHIHAP